MSQRVQVLVSVNDATSVEQVASALRAVRGVEQVEMA